MSGRLACQMASKQQYCVERYTIIIGDIFAFTSPEYSNKGCADYTGCNIVFLFLIPLDAFFYFSLHGTFLFWIMSIKLSLPFQVTLDTTQSIGVNLRWTECYTLHKNFPTMEQRRFFKPFIRALVTTIYFPSDLAYNALKKCDSSFHPKPHTMNSV